ncbi:hypothetical protein ABW19_dt0206112 [Dactylella cylindrospora]|nr:hypothetical protein ABW19_dt0206112 [Dactylella cylindrospora]
MKTGDDGFCHIASICMRLALLYSNSCIMSLLSPPPRVQTHSLFGRLHLPPRGADANLSKERPLLSSSSSIGVFGSESDSDSSESVDEVVDGGDMFSMSSMCCLHGMISYSSSSSHGEGITVCSDSKETLRDKDTQGLE